MLRWLASMNGSSVRLGLATVSTPISVPGASGSKTGAATCITVRSLPGNSGLERAPYSPRRVL